MFSHLYAANSGEKRPIYDAVRKHGWDNFTKEIIAEVEGEQAAFITELIYIQQYNSIERGYNLSEETSHGGDNWRGRRETKAFEKFVQKMKAINSQGKMHGRTHSPEARQKQKAAAVGRFSLPWFIARHGQTEGTQKWEQRNQSLRDRRLQKGVGGRFISQ